MLNERGEAAKVAVQSKAGGCDWTFENFPELSYVLVYGTTAVAKVTMDGEILPQVTSGDFGSMPMGWKVDPAGNRLVIRLPLRQVPHSQMTTEISLEFNPT